ncbi:hypothetical protein, partial [uncultured Megasphaera sp.]|uniref:hypothetical protein n=1 Tax=uncultured Megasphaera sp. TaxID=165188 RepID=UPI002658BD1F
AISAGQTFRGMIIGEEQDLQALADGLAIPKEGAVCRLGRSKYTQYGQCRLSLGTLEPLPPVQIEGTSAYLVLDTPLIPEMEVADGAQQPLAQVVEALNSLTGGHHFSLGMMQSALTEIDNFVSVWALRRPRQGALAAGTVFEIRKDGDWTADDMAALQTLLYGGCGQRREEGFGQLRVWPQRDWVWKPDMPEEILAVPSEQPVHIQSDEVRQCVAAIIEKRMAEEIRSQAYEDAADIQGQAAGHGVTHVFARLESLLGSRCDLPSAKQRFCRRLREEVPEGSAFEGHLKALQIHHVSLYDMFYGSGVMPYEGKTFTGGFPASLLEAAAIPKDAEEGVVFYEYWLWLFRHGRKSVQYKQSSEGVE